MSLPPQFSTNVDAAGLGRPGFLAGGGILPNTIVGALTPNQARFWTQGYIPDQKRPQSIQWNFGIQHVFAQDYTAEVRYLGTRGLFLPLQVQLNRQAVVNPANALRAYLSMSSQAALDGLSNTLAPLQAGFRNGRQLDLSRPRNAVDATLLAWRSVSGVVHPEPQYRRFHGGGFEHCICAAPATGFAKSAEREGKFHAGSSQPAFSGPRL